VEADTTWGKLRYLTPCVERQPVPLGTHPAAWL
jgi:hypothetical protein